MAQRRMFNKTITNNDKFLEMPMGSQVLYFHLSMNADDDGFVDNWKSIMRMIGAKEDDLKVLVAKQYIIPFESGVIVIRHWRINNYLQNDRITPTNYQDELAQLQLEKGNVYTMYTKCIHSIDKNSIEENSIEEKENIKRKKFEKPTIEEIAEYCKERNNGINANAFYDFYESKDWYVGKNRMKDWKACVRTWEQRLPKKESVPDWFNKELKNEPVSEEDQREMEELLKELQENISGIKG